MVVFALSTCIKNFLRRHGRALFPEGWLRGSLPPSGSRKPPGTLHPSRGGVLLEPLSRGPDPPAPYSDTSTLSPSLPITSSKPKYTPSSSTSSTLPPSPKVSKDGLSIGVGGFAWYPEGDILELKVARLHFGKPKRGKISESVKFFDETDQSMDEFVPS